MSANAPPYYARLNKQSLNVNPVTNSLKRAYEQNAIPSLPALRSAILPHRARPGARASIDEYVPSELGQRVDELLSRFFTNNGISYDSVEDPSLIQLISMINPQIKLPTPVMMEGCVSRLAYPMKVKTAVNYQKAVGPLTVTMSTYTHNDEIFLVYSIHFFDDYVQRRTAVYMKKLIICELDGESIITYLRRSINNFNYGHVRFTNLVTTDEDLAKKLHLTNAVTNSYICFFTYLTRFINEVMKIEEFQTGLDCLRSFILFLRRHSDLYSKFRRMQLSKNGDLDLPCLDDGKWTSTTVFLTRCLILHETFSDFAVRFRLTTYISDDTYSKLSYLQRLMSHTRRFAKELSTPESTVSQVVPTVISIRGFLEGKSVGFEFEADVKRVFRRHLQPLLNGVENHRYDFATLLDPRYGYRDSIYLPEKWLAIEKELLARFETEEMVINEKHPSETIVLKPHSKYLRMTKIKEELKLYRSNLAAARPNVTTNVFGWWGSRMMELINLFNKSRELLAPPAVAVDTEIYFGRHGKLAHMTSKLNYEQLENALSVAGQQETFKGRGYISESALAPIMTEARRRLIPRATALLPRPPIDYSKSRVPETSLMPDMSDMMMEPPPSKKAYYMREPPHSGEDDTTMDPPEPKKAKMLTESEVKKEVDMETSQPSASTNLPKPHEMMKEVKQEVDMDDVLIKIEPPEESKPPVLEVKAEIVDDGYEDVKPPVLLPNPPTPPMEPSPPAPARPNPPARSTPPAASVPGARSTLAARPTGPVRPSPVGRPNLLRPPSMGRPNQLIRPPTQSRMNLGYSHQPTRPNPAARASPPACTTAPVRTSPPPPSVPSAPPFQKSQASMHIPKRVSEHKCNICLKVEDQGTVKEVNLPNEKLLVLLGMVVDSKISLDEARYCYSKPTPPKICLHHHSESGAQLYAALGIEDAEEVFSIPQEQMKFVMDYITDIKGKTMPLMAFKQLFIIYAEKYPPIIKKSTTEPITFDGIFSQSKSSTQEKEKQAWSQKTSLLPKSLRPQRKSIERDVDSPIYQKMQELGYNQENRTASTSTILPKSQRAPRKQKFEENDSQSDDMVIRRVVPIAIPEPAEKIKNPGKCSYCSKTVERSDLIRVPKSENRRKIWFEKLGEKFERKVKAFENSFICRAHFSKSAFSKTGRLVKNALPYRIGERVSYEVVEDHLLPSDEDSDSDEDYQPETKLTPNQMLTAVVKDEDEEKPSTSVFKRQTRSSCK